jgi:cytochrome c oxidase accessory protein FixG
VSTPAPEVKGESFYVAAEKIYPREVAGRFDTLRRAAVVVLLGLYYVLPWINWNGRQCVLFDLPARKFHIFALTLWPQDFIYLSWLLIIAALALFFFTAVGGRLWCGYACPQTVWTEAFVWMERLTEGKRAARMHLDRGPWTMEKILRKSAKQVLWVSFSLWTGLTFVGYFTPIRTLTVEVAQLALGPWEWFWMLFYGFATYGNAGYLREQVCKYMCPYARFQSAMFDRDTLIITYDTVRGEPRGSRRRGSDPRTQGLGDCIDCKICVQVCPTGIDIREGLQYECIACAACIDACDSVMDRMNYPRGLIRYTTQSALASGRAHVIRPRIVIYGTLLALLAAGFVIALTLRTPFDLDVMRDRNALYRELPEDTVENVYMARLLNKDEHAHDMAIDVSGPLPIELDPPRPVVHVESGAVANVPVRVRTRDHSLPSFGFEVHVRAVDEPGLEAHAKARFIQPVHHEDHHD